MRARIGRRLAQGLGLTLFAGLAYLAGQSNGPPWLAAQTPAPAVEEPASDYAQRIVATIHGSVHITREDLGEYLIQRMGADRLELLVNKRIIDHECQQRGIVVTAQEVQAALTEDCKGLGVDTAQFVGNVLKQYGKTLYEWKEDVIRPRLQLQKICQDRLEVTDEDRRQMFESLYGEKVKCRIILFDKTAANQKHVGQVWERVRNDEKEFLKEARTQGNGYLAARGGEIQPVAHYAAEDEAAEKLEKTAFSLTDGEVSPIIEVPQGFIILKRDGLLPPEKGKSIAEEMDRLTSLVTERKIKKMIPKIFEELSQKAAPVMYLKKGITEQEFKGQIEKTLKETSPLRSGS